MNDHHEEEILAVKRDIAEMRARLAESRRDLEHYERELDLREASADRLLREVRGTRQVH